MSVKPERYMNAEIALHEAAMLYGRNVTTRGGAHYPSRGLLESAIEYAKAVVEQEQEDAAGAPPVYGDPRLPERFWAKARQDESGCWTWTAHKSAAGYGRFIVDGATRLAHRISYGAMAGELPPGSSGLELDHLCRNRACVNPAHLELVTGRENYARGISPAAATLRSRMDTGLCTQGHDDWRPGVAGRVVCMTCQRKKTREQHATIREARRALGMTRKEYEAAYGWSRVKARAILAELNSKADAS